MTASAHRDKSQLVETVSDAEDTSTMTQPSRIVTAPEVKSGEPDLPPKFRVIRLLGEGGMGRVFEVEDVGLGTTFAIKVMHRDWLGDDSALQRFRAEAAAAGELIHPHIAQVYDFSTQEPTPHILMEYVEGPSFDKVLKRERIIEQERLLNIALQICDALEYAHLHGVVHRDLKPSNIILQDAGDIVKLVDFGIAKVGPKNESVTQMTQKGEVFGSPMYMSPEQAEAAPIDHRTDLYSLGCTLYEALAGKSLFGGESAVHVLLQHLNSPVRPATRKLLKKGYSRSLVAVLEKLLEKQPAKRYQSAGELAGDLRRILKGQISLALLKRPFLIDIPTRTALISLAVTAALGLIGMCTLTTLTVARLESSRSSAHDLYADLVYRQNEARALVNRIVHGSDKDMLLAAKALGVLVSEDPSTRRFPRNTFATDGKVPSSGNELLSASDQREILSAYNRSKNPDTKMVIFEALSELRTPIPELVSLGCDLCKSSDLELRFTARNAISNWTLAVSKKEQKELSTLLSSFLVETLDQPESNKPVMRVDSVAASLNQMSEFSDQAIQNIRAAALLARKDFEANVYWSDTQHPLAHLALLKKQYYPELTALLNSRTYERSTLAALNSLGPKAKDAVPALCKALSSANIMDLRSVYAVLGAIGPSAAPDAIPVLTKHLLRKHGDDAEAAAATLAKMGPSGIAVLRKEAARPRRIETAEAPGINDSIDAAQDALSNTSN